MDKTIEYIAKLCKQNDILYGIGGSKMIKDIYFDVKVNDIDIFIKASDVKRFKKLFVSYEKAAPVIDRQYQSLFYGKYEFNGVNVDVMADMGVYYQFECYRYQLNDISQIQEHNDRDYMFLEDWFYIYWLIKRSDKINMISDYWLNDVKCDQLRVDYLTKQKIPADLKTYLKNLK